MTDKIKEELSLREIGISRLGYEMGKQETLEEVKRIINKLPKFRKNGKTYLEINNVEELKSKLHHSQQTKPFKVGLEDEKQGSLDTTDISRKEGYIAEMPEDKTADPRKREIEQLETKLMTLGMNGMAYTSFWNETVKKLSKLKEKR